jgi:hypothetical protein
MESDAPQKARPKSKWVWAWLLLPAAGLVELGAHAVQLRRVVPNDSWRAAGKRAGELSQPGDTFVFAPFWTDALGRMGLGRTKATFSGVASMDARLSRRAIELSIHGARAPELAGWRQASEETIQGVTIRVLENPAPVRVLDDAITRVAEHRADVHFVETGSTGEVCAWTQTRAVAGQFWDGPAAPAQRYDCKGRTYVGASVAAMGEQFVPRYCVYAPSHASGTLRVSMPDFRFGSRLRGYHGLSQLDHAPGGVKLTIRASRADRTDPLGTYTVALADGLRAFEVDTSALAGQTSTLDAQISAAGKHEYCFQLVSVDEGQ